MTLRCRQFSVWLTQNVNLKRASLLFCVTCIWNWYENSVLQTKQVCHKSFKSVSCLSLVNAIIPWNTTSHLLQYFTKSALAPWTYFCENPCLKPRDVAKIPWKPYDFARKFSAFMKTLVETCNFPDTLCKS